MVRRSRDDSHLRDVGLFLKTRGHFASLRVVAAFLRISHTARHVSVYFTEDFFRRFRGGAIKRRGGFAAAGHVAEPFSNVPNVLSRGLPWPRPQHLFFLPTPDSRDFSFTLSNRRKSNILMRLETLSVY